MKNSGNPGSIAPKIIPRAAHNVSRNEFSKSALKVLYRLNKAGYQAFLVGGCVRDAMLVLHPKDFDVATNATPEEVRALFGNCRLIGRRFRLAHVRFGREIIEVATFRAAANHVDDDVEHDREGRIIRDNVYGTIDEDVWRRDFTCNALYYNIADFSIWDYVGGVEDVERRQLVLIGDPEQRLREDPVRMLRAVRFAAKLDFSIDAPVVEAMHHHASLLSNVPAARLFDEFLKLFQSGHAERTFDLLREHGLFAEMFPATEQELLADDDFMKFVRAALQNTDRRVAAGKSVTPMFLLGVFFWLPVRKLAAIRRSEEKMSETQSLSLASYDIVAAQQRLLSIPRRFTVPMREMLALQPRFLHTAGKRAMKLLEHRRFRAAYDFMVLLAEVGQVDADIAKFWTDVQTQSTSERGTSFKMDAQPGKKRRARSRRRRKRPQES
ncbi:MAG: polynucleotide adenylyltransferase PcnB [Gammaproteobacteria bacterium]|nr:polynucleotide adenylyltransferase PcnB [Gammaproteobacteria bacterium]MBU2676951.1 polynucleotide adenylyltransferase PcnB [Gammaproteobacteria bacterium]NNC56768.1 polynucleotide adenylyltransferase PcnB [Woeseiaceae bacterium]NNL50684.1 polynucleotide adenylyltransferase PcnB [Woeseiaceae bacterium]